MCNGPVAAFGKAMIGNAEKTRCAVQSVKAFTKGAAPLAYQQHITGQPGTAYKRIIALVHTG